MSSEQAYEAVFRFLDQFWSVRKKEYDDDLPILLGSMNRTTWTDGLPADPAYIKIWQECSNYKTELTADDAFAALIRLLNNYISLGEGEPRDIGRLLREIERDPETYKSTFDEIARNSNA